MYKVRYEVLSLLEEQSQAGTIDLFYGDESSVSEEGYVPYGWQFKDESVHIQVAKGQRRNRTDFYSTFDQYLNKNSK